MLKSNLCRKAYIMHKAPIQDRIYLGICLLFCLYVFVSIFTHTIEIKLRGNSIVRAEELQQPIIKEVITKVPDKRVNKLKTFLESKHSPLSPYTELIIEEADKYDIGYTKIVSISGIESAFATRLPQGSYNAWGLGGSRFMWFDSWEDSIRYTSRLLGTAYKTNELAGIKEKYCPKSDGCNPSWVFVVAKASTDILGIE